MSQPDNVHMGSSPLTRGKRVAASAACVTDGLIPAHAGKTSSRERAVFSIWAHPRSRGENDHRNVANTSLVGSSPLTRGKPVSCSHGLMPYRLIPAHAGKTTAARGDKIAGAAHPRSRRENASRVKRRSCALGSSPLTRGKRRRAWPPRCRSRLIPAHAGKTPACISTVMSRPAHPRSRGENPCRALMALCLTGSSPLTRGKPQCPPIGVRVLGLIPAHAGKTLFDKTHVTSRRAHPRSRGENAAGIASVALTQGSSPLTRGKRYLVQPGDPVGRLIPAHAGKTKLTRNVACVACGSSPLTRGKRVVSLGRVLRCRLIPAHAGKTTHPATPASPSWAHPRSRGENR